jgi:cell division protein FtsX
MTFLLIVVVAILLGLFCNFFLAKLSTCQQCASSKKETGVWKSFERAQTERTHTDNNSLADDILGDDD